MFCSMCVIVSKSESKTDLSGNITKEEITHIHHHNSTILHSISTKQDSRVVFPTPFKASFLSTCKHLINKLPTKLTR